MKPKNTSSGGGVFFVKNLVSYLINKNYIVTFNLESDIDIIFIIDPRKNSTNHISIDMILEYKKMYPNVKIIHRVNECDIKREKSINIEQLLLKTMQIADHVVFISKWLQDYFIKKYSLNLLSYNCILNGCNIEHFFPSNNKKLQNNKIKIVTHHWSNNYLKGFHIYNAIDKLLESRKDIEFTFIGNYNPNYRPKNIKLIKPTNGKELGDLLRQQDIYLTASQNEPCGMHQLEGMSCGLPLLYCDGGGGIKETCNNGEEYHNIETLLIKIDLIKNNYNDYVNKIYYEYLSSERCCEEYMNTLINI